ncbi:D-2-hydroxyacid dehydrogenase family protein [Roseitranquillus sediminis]|uniref:D-2-hydroxyacid dehydrogenase family protein n=1 Tax=Roseitranquillus sediminis TaxID=2809051 RepID=UPI001D0C499F|nr:D-2-hydroxyacid dehydrogenase family protein [Roseitranquillus sediminis]MBM9593853.1 D-2-hydroxyacid dehydrogenase family protein [Roseitranquillus sediminis]
MRIHILDDYFDTLRTLPSFAKLDGHEVTVWTDRPRDEDELARRIADAEALVLIRERTRVTESLVDRLPRLRLVSQRSVYPHIDVPALTRRRILLCSDLHMDSHCVAAAELTFALLLTAARQLPDQIASVRAGRWQAGVGRTLHGRTLGLYGYGRIGRAVAGYARAFGMNVVWWSSEEGRARARADGEPVADSREAFFSGCDAISLHLRHKPATQGIVTREDLMAMRPDAILVNTSRAGLIAPGALLAALDAGRPGTAALDVFDAEPVTDPDDPIVSHPRVIPTPHIGYVTAEELDVHFHDIYDQIIAFERGDPINVINPEVLDAPVR